MWRTVSTGSRFEEMAPYSRALFDDEWVFVSGTTGFDYSTMEISDDPAEQTRRTWENVAAALREAGSGLEEIVRFLLVVSNRRHVEAVLSEMSRALPVRPSGTLIVADLIDERILVEVEVTAKKAPGARRRSRT
jgi:enamine deaminase RidA (YjgF/YER057c/UK114 family)